MSWLHCFWGVGTIVSPFVMSWALTHATWHSGYQVIAFLQFGIALLLLVTLPVWNIHKRQACEDAKHINPRGALKIRSVPSLLLVFSPTAPRK